jgi:hypothetical protein
LGSDNTCEADIKDTKQNIQVGYNLVRVMHNQRQDAFKIIMEENQKILNRIVNVPQTVITRQEIKRRNGELKKLHRLIEGS